LLRWFQVPSVTVDAAGRAGGGSPVESYFGVYLSDLVSESRYNIYVEG